MTIERVIPTREDRVEEALAQALCNNTNMRERLIDQMMNYMEERPNLFNENQKFTRDDCESRIYQIFSMND